MFPSTKAIVPFLLRPAFLFCLLITTVILSSCADPPPEQTGAKAMQRKDYKDNSSPASRRTPSSRLPAQDGMDKGQSSREELVLAQSMLLPNLALVTERIDAYEQKSIQFTKISADFATYGFDRGQTERLIECRRMVSDILFEYQQVKHNLVNYKSAELGSPSFGELFVRAERRDIAYLETDCNGLSAAILSPKSSGGRSLSPEDLRNAEEEMKIALDNKDYDRVLTIYRSLPEMPSDEKHVIFNHLRTIYGEALIKNGSFDEAISVFSDILAEINKYEMFQNQFTLTNKLADLYFSIDDQDRAREIYNVLGGFYTDLMKENEWARVQLGALDVSDHKGELRDYAALLKKYLAYIPNRDGYTIVEQATKFSETYPFSGVTQIADRIKNETKTAAEQWFSSLITKVDTMIAQQEYQEAQLLLDAIPSDILTAEKQDLLLAKSGEIQTAEAIEAERKRLAIEQALQENWNQALLSLEKKLYDEAIDIFTSMKDTPYAAKAEKYIEETIELAVQDARRRAAELFIRSTKSADQENKIKLLLSSRRILRDILNKYPQTNLADKVTGNIQKIEDEITMIDPSLLNEVDPNVVDPNLNLASPVQ